MCTAGLQTMALSFTYSTQSDKVDIRGSGGGREKLEERKVEREEEDGAIRRRERMA